MEIATPLETTPCSRCGEEITEGDMKTATRINVLWRMLFLVIAMLSVILTACNDDEDPIAEIPVAYVSIYHAAPSGQALDVIVDDEQINAGPVEYTDRSGYLRFRTGTRNLKFTPYNGDNILAEADVEFSQDVAYSVFVYELENEDLDILVANDDTSPPATGKTKIRFINLSPDAPALSLVAEQLDDPIFEDEVFEEATDFKELEAKVYSISIEGDGTTLMSIDDVLLVEGRAYTILVRGYYNPPSGNDNDLVSEIITNY